MTIGVEEMVAMTNLRRVSNKVRHVLLMLTCRRKRKEDELEAGTPEVARIQFCSLYRGERGLLSSVTATVT